jgi:hypothetical protein
VFGTDVDMNAVEFGDDVSQAEGSEVLPQASAPGLRVKRHSEVMLIADIQNRKSIRGDSLEHTAVFDLLDDGRDKAFTIEGHVESLLCPGNDFRDMKGLIGGEEYVINDTHLGPTGSSGLKPRLFSLYQELSDRFQLRF